MWIESSIAMRFLRHGRAQTLLILFGIAVGVAVIVFVTALIGGLQANIIDRTLGTQAHVRVEAPREVNLVAPAPRGTDPFAPTTVTTALGTSPSAASTRSTGISVSERLIRRLLSPCRSRLHAMISANMDTAISAGVTAPIDRPMGVCVRLMRSASRPSSISACFSAPTRRREPIMPT